MTDVLVNDDRHEKAMAALTTAAKNQAKGSEAMAQCAIIVARAVSDGVFTFEKDAKGLDDIDHAYDKFASVRAKSAVFDCEPVSRKQQLSKFRQVAIAAAKTTCDFSNTLENRLPPIRRQLAKDGEKRRPIYHSMIEAARLQTKQDDDLTDDQLKVCIRRPEPNEKTVERELEKLVKRMSDLIEGKDGVICEDPALVEARDTVRGIVATFTKAKEMAETRAKAIELGLIADEAE